MTLVPGEIIQLAWPYLEHDNGLDGHNVGMQTMGAFTELLVYQLPDDGNVLKNYYFIAESEPCRIYFV